jgi:hypothetical protein
LDTIDKMNHSQNKQLQRIITKINQVGGEISNEDAQRIRQRIQYMEKIMNQFNRSLYPDIKFFIHFNTQNLFTIASSFPLMNYTINTKENGELNNKIPYKPDPDFMSVSNKPKNKQNNNPPFDGFIQNPSIFQPIAPAYLLYHNSLPGNIEEKAQNRLLLSLQNQFQIHQQTDYTQCLKNKDNSWFIHQQQQALSEKYQLVLNNKKNNFIQPFTDLCRELFRLVESKDKGARKNLLEKENTKKLFSQVMDMDSNWNLLTSRVLTSNVKPLMIIYKDNTTKTKGFILKKGDDLRNDAFVIAGAHLLNNICELNIPTYNVIPVGKVGNVPITYKGKDTYGIIEFIEEGGDSLASYHKKQNGGQIKGLRGLITSRIQKVHPEWFYKSLIRDKIPNAKGKIHNNFKKSLIGSILLQWIFGLHDRHSDNMMILPDGRIANIDFNRIMNMFRTKDISKKSKDALVYAPFIFSPEFAYAIHAIYSPNVGITMKNTESSYWEQYPDFGSPYGTFANQQGFKDFAEEIIGEITKIVSNKQQILQFVKYMSYTNNSRFLITPDDEKFKNKNYINPNKLTQEGEHFKNIPRDTNLFGYRYVSAVLEEFEKIFNLNDNNKKVSYILKKLYISMKLTPYPFLFGVHELAQRIKSSSTKTKENTNLIQVLRENESNAGNSSFNYRNIQLDG